MAFKRALTPQQERALCNEYTDGWTVKELTIIYRVSQRTVYRLLADYGVPKRQQRTKKRRTDRSTKQPAQLKPCGTNAAYHRHRRKGEYPCSPCLAAHAENVADAKDKSKRKKEQSEAGSQDLARGLD